jgi:hypothetical protein
MMPFSAASVTALEIALSPLDTGLFAYHDVLCMDVTTNARNAPKLVSLLLAQMQLDKPDIVFTDGADKRIDNNDLPTDKLSFDATFGVSTTRTSLNCHLTINSSRTFHQIKIGVWQILQKHRIFLDKSPGPISKRDLVPMGFWMHVHPGFASTRAFHNQLSNNISDNYTSSPVVAELNLPADYSEPDVYFTPSKCKGTYEQTSIQSNALFIYGSRDDFDRITTLVTRISSFATTDDNKTPLYVPFALKKSHPEIYGQYLAQQNAFLASPTGVLRL